VGKDHHRYLNNKRYRVREENSFRDDVHQKEIVASIGDGNFDVATRGFKNTDDFYEKFQNSMAYLDIGPGFGQAIFESNAPAKGVADISMTAIRKIQEKDPEIEGYSISEPPPTSKYDLATCISVAQHCDADALRNLMNFSYVALQSGGTLWIEGICAPDGSNSGHNIKNTKTGHHMWNSEDILNLWPGKCIYNYSEILGPKLNAWWLGLEKD